jgi:peptide/nickel transport system substrate-binding protein
MFVGMNPTFKPWDNQLVRQAVAHAIDKEALIKGVLEGRAYALDGALGPGMYSYDPNVKSPYTYDPEKAKQLLAQAGYPNGLDVEYASPVGRYNKDKELSEAIVHMLARVGIRASMKTPEWATFWGDVQAGKQPMYLIGRGSVVDPSEYLHQYFRTAVTKRLGFSDPEVDRLLAAEQQEFEPQERIKLLRQAAARITEASPAAFLFQYEDTYGVSNKVEYKARSDEYVLAWEAKPR